VVIRRSYGSPLRAVRIDTTRADEIESAIQRRFAVAPERFRDQTPLPGSQAALRRMIDNLGRNVQDASGISTALADKVAGQPALFHETIQEFGALRTITFQGVGPGGYDIYQVQFANGSAEFKIYLSANGTIEDVNFSADGDATPGGVAPCQTESILKSPHDTAPIKLILTNHSGSDLRLFWLDFDGHRVAHGNLPDHETRQFVTNTSRPFVIADQSGNCHELILAGQRTRLHVVEPLGSSGSLASATPRTEPNEGSELALRQYMDGLLRGIPNYDGMTPEAGAATRELLPQRQAVLNKLGALRTIQFRGVSPSDTDIYAVRFANGAAEWQIGLTEGRIASIALGPP